MGIGAGAGLLVGGGIGAAIGSSIKKHPTTAIVPIVNYTEDGIWRYGLGIQSQF